VVRDLSVVTAAMIGASTLILVVAPIVLSRRGPNGWFDVALLIGTFVLALAGYFYVIFRPEIRKWRRRRAGLCLGCGYDRRGTALDARCPECGLSS